MIAALVRRFRAWLSPPPPILDRMPTSPMLYDGDPLERWMHGAEFDTSIPADWPEPRK